MPGLRLEKTGGVFQNVVGFFRTSTAQMSSDCLPQQKGMARSDSYA
jgi:hypothetical protein